MKRRAALALALCLTTIVGFFIVGYGMQIGFFGGGNGTGDAAAQSDRTAEPTQPPAAAAPAQPEVIEQYVYRDVYVSSPGEGAASTGSAGATGGGGAPKPPQETAPITETKPPTPTATPTPQQTPQAGESVEFTGEVTAVSGSTFTVDSRSGQFTVTIGPSTTVHGGSIEVGATVKVHGRQGADGIVSANEIEVGGGD